MIACFIPCYNCSLQVSRMLERREFKLLSESVDMYFINNCSQDNTLEVIKSKMLQHKIKAKIISNHQNWGLGGSFKIAVKLCQEKKIDSFLWFHGDDQASTEDAIKMLEVHQQDSSFEMILGARFMPGSRRKNYDKIRTIGNIILNYLASLVLRKRVYDLGSGLSYFKTSIFKDEKILEWPDHMAFDIRLLKLAMKNKSKFHPIFWVQEDQRSNAQNMRVGFQVIAELLPWFSSKAPKEKLAYSYDVIAPSVL